MEPREPYGYTQTTGVALGGLVAPVPPSVNVVIEKVENGFIVRVGCKTFVSQSFTEVATGLELYYSNPEEAMKKFLNKK